QAEEIIDVQVSHFMNWIRSLDAVDTIRAVRETAETKRDIELELALKQIAGGKDPEVVLKQFAHRLTNKLLHEPSTQLKQAGYEGRTELLKAARDLFDLKTSDL
ncbi:MAG: glutamyl-tRNA reductase, partial [Gammaproteobacteria bacterium]